MTQTIGMKKIHWRHTATISLSVKKQNRQRKRYVSLASTYFGPVQWYQKLNRDECAVEQHEHFVKQTYRNRCVIATTNGKQTLSIPVEKFDGPKCKMKDVRISDHDNWRHQHWNALLSAYGESPFFEFYQDDIHPFLRKMGFSLRFQQRDNPQNL